MNIQNIYIHWARPDLVWLLTACIVTFAGILIYRMRKRKRAIALLTSVSMIQQSLPGYAYYKSVTKVCLFLGGIVFLCIALMRPQWHETEINVAQEGRDVLVALDISRSMLAQDLLPDRLACAKQKIKSLLQQLKSERVGLLLFSGSTFLQCPMTDDVGAFLMFLDAIDVETISSGTTAIDQAIQEAIYVFEKVPDRKSKLLLIFTDGEDFSSNLSSVKKKAAALGLHIITVGVGTSQGAPIPLYDKRGQQIGHQLDSKNNVVISRLNEGILQRLAEDTGGIYVSLSQHGTEDIQEIKKFLSSFEKEQLADKQMKQYQEQYQWPLFISFICLVLEWLL